MSKADLLEAWGAHLRDGRRRSPHTVRAYVAAADRLLAETGIEDFGEVAALDGPALRRQLALRRSDGLVNTSAARELSALKGFVAFARSQSGGEASAPRLRGPRIKKGLPRPVTPDEAVNLAGRDAVRNLPGNIVQYGNVYFAAFANTSDLLGGFKDALWGNSITQRAIPLQSASDIIVHPRPFLLL